jgi:hypothetical protein
VGPCPACASGKHGLASFGRMPTDYRWTRWSCLSDGHGARSGVGRPGGGSADSTPCWYGDAIDLEAHARGFEPSPRGRAALLRADGFLTDRPLTDHERREIRARKERQRREEEQRRREAAEHLRRLVAWWEAGPTLTARPTAEPWTVAATVFRALPNARRGPLPTASARHGELEAWTWADLRRIVAEPPELPTVPPNPPPRADTPKSWLPGWAPTRFGPLEIPKNHDSACPDVKHGRPCRGNHRHASTVVESGALALDLDADRGDGAGDPDLDPWRLAELMSAALPGVAWLAHTSPSSNPDGCGWRWRVVLPLSRPVDLSEYATLADAVRIFAVLAGSEALEADTGWRQAERFYYLPGRTEHYAHAVGVGLPLNPDAIATMGITHE